jgi:solute carrier family 41
MDVTQESNTGLVSNMYAKTFPLSDNIAPPIASCLGDLVTLSLLGVISSILINVVNTPIPLICATLIILSATLCAFLVRRNSSVKDLIYQGWVPLFGAMVISCATGIVLDMFASRYKGFPLLAIVISGEYRKSY